MTDFDQKKDTINTTNTPVERIQLLVLYFFSKNSRVLLYLFFSQISRVLLYLFFSQISLVLLYLF